MKPITIAHHRAKTEQHLECIEQLANIAIAKPAITSPDGYILVAGLLWEKEFLSAKQEKEGVWYKEETNVWYFNWENAMAEAKEQGKKLPTDDQFKQLVKHTNWTWVERSGQKGILFTDKENGNELFWPALGLVFPGSGALGLVASYGYYWSASPYADATYARYLDFYSAYVDPAHGSVRSCGFPVRCVKEVE